MKILYSRTFRYILAGIALLIIVCAGTIGYKD